MKLQIHNSPQELESVWVHVKERATLAPKPYVLEVPEEELELAYKGIREEKTGWNEFFSECREVLGYSLVIGGIIEHAVGEEKPDKFKYVISTVDHFKFENGTLRISGDLEDFDPSKF
jgi:hypothetical protein